MADAKFEKSIYGTCKSCDVSLRSRPQEPSRKISLTHVNRDFYDDIKTDLISIRIKSTVYSAIHIFDTDTAYFEGSVMNDRQPDMIMNQFDRILAYRNAVPNYISGDDKFNWTPIRKSFQKSGVFIKPRPSRKHIKFRIIEKRCHKENRGASTIG